MKRKTTLSPKRHASRRPVQGSGQAPRKARPPAPQGFVLSSDEWAALMAVAAGEDPASAWVN